MRGLAGADMTRKTPFIYRWLAPPRAFTYTSPYRRFLLFNLVAHGFAALTPWRARSTHELRYIRTDRSS